MVPMKTIEIQINRHYDDILNANQDLNNIYNNSRYTFKVI